MSCGTDGFFAIVAGPPPVGTVVEELSSVRFPMFSTLVSAVVYAGLADALSEKKDYLLLCPTNDAFERAQITVTGSGGFALEGKHLKKEEVAAVLENHVVKLADLANVTELTAMSGKKITVSTDDNKRTTVMLEGGSSACVLMRGFVSSNAAFAALGRVLK